MSRCGWYRQRAVDTVSIRLGTLDKITYNCSTVLDADSNWHISELNVVEDDRTLEVTWARATATNKDRGVGNDGVNDGLSTNSLSTSVGGAALTQVEADLTVVDSDTCEGV